MYGITFLSKTYGAMVQPALKFTVERLRWADPGGPSEARIIAAGSDLDLTGLAHLLRHPVEIWDDRGRVVWWGYLAGLEVRGVRFDLSALANKVKAGYKFVVDQGMGTGVSQFYTGWVSDLSSQADYGIKEKVIAANTNSLTIAESQRDQTLSRQAWPVPAYNAASDTPKQAGRDSDAGSAVLTCRGWYETLGWVHYENAAGIEAYTIEGVGVQNVGEVSGNTQIRQAFVPTTPGWDTDTVWIKACKVGAPADNLQVNIRDSGDSNILASGSLSGASIAVNNYSWLKFTLNTTITLPSGGYFLHVSRSGSLDAGKYYKVKVNEAAGYTYGTFRIWNGSTWVARSPDASLNFEIMGKAETTSQITDILSGDCGQFIKQVQIVDASGLYSSPYRSGSKTGLQEITDLLAAGTSGAAELTATVLRDRTLRVTRKDQAAVMKVTAGGAVTDPWGQPAQAGELAGKWALIDLPGIGLFEKQYICRVETDGKGKVRLDY